MIVSRQMAEEAARSLQFVGINGGSPLDGLDAEAVQQGYRNLAKLYHPDNLETGSPSRFVEIDKAKCVLLKWLSRPQAAPVETEISGDKCPMCKGTGRRTLRRGFRSMTMVCGTCRGMGEIVKPDKVEE